MMERRAILIRGIVQGVGFRPFVYNLAVRLGLGGFVKNQTGTVCIEVEGEPAVLERFLAELADRPPPLARIEHLSWERRPPRGESRFPHRGQRGRPRRRRLHLSRRGRLRRLPGGSCSIPATAAIGYPFLNCTNCGPRLTIITGAPYDRAADDDGRLPHVRRLPGGIRDPTNRRFHAQPTACPACGPRLQLRDGAGQADPTPTTRSPCSPRALRDGRIGALKGLGGYHLACDARNAGRRRGAAAAQAPRREAVRRHGPGRRGARDCSARSGRRKRRFCGRRDGRSCCCARTGGLTPRSPTRSRRAIPGSASCCRTRRCTICSCGRVGRRAARHDQRQPLRRADRLSKTTTRSRRLAGIADLFLIHDRPIHVRCDDSVTRVVDGTELPMRRSRGYAPRPIALPFPCPRPILAVGGQLKGTFALGRGRQAFLSHHLGDLDHYDAYRAFVKDVALYEELFGVAAGNRGPRPASGLRHDALCPASGRTRWAPSCSPSSIIMRTWPACMAEHGLTEPVIGVTFDGTGYGTDGAIWGGEFLVGDYRGFRRAAHLRYVGLPGGEQAIREPWRMAVGSSRRRRSRLRVLSGAHFASSDFATVERMIERRFNTPLTSSAGRLFDAVAALAGVRDRVSYEGQAAMELEWLADSGRGRRGLSVRVWRRLPEEGRWSIDTRPLIRAAAEDAMQGRRTGGHRPAVPFDPGRSDRRGLRPAAGRDRARRRGPERRRLPERPAHRRGDRAALQAKVSACTVTAGCRPTTAA